MQRTQRLPDMPIAAIENCLGRSLPKRDDRFDRRKQYQVLPPVTVCGLLILVTKDTQPVVSVLLLILLIIYCCLHCFSVWHHNQRHDQLNAERAEYREYARQKAGSIRKKMLPIVEVEPTVKIITIPTTDKVGRSILFHPAHRVDIVWNEEMCAEHCIAHTCYYDDEGMWQPGMVFTLYLRRSRKIAWEQ